MLLLISFYQPECTFNLDKTLFAHILATTLHLFSNGLSRMVYEHLSGCFISKDPSSWFSKLFQTIIVIAHGDIPRLMALMLQASRLLAMVKDFKGFCPIIVGEVFLRLISHSIIL
jgi:hypothetical protein